MSNFMEDYNFINIHTGDIVKGKIIRVSDDGIIADIGYKSDAFVPKNELVLNTSKNIKEYFNIGDIIDLYIEKKENEDGNVLASKVLADKEVAKEKLQKAFNDGEVIEGEIIEAVKSGVIASIFGVKAFIPASLLSLHYVKDLNEYIGKTLKLKIIEFIPDKKLIASHKAVLELERKEKKEQLFKSIKEGDTINGIVKNIVDYGAFIDIGGFDAFLPISEMSWGKIKKPDEIIKIGDNVSVYILNIDKEKNKITLSLKNILQDPWIDAENKYHVGDVLKATISNITTFGIFATLEVGIDGLIYKNNLENNIKDYKVENSIQVEILSIDINKRKISLKEVPPVEDIPELDTQKLNITIGDIINKNNL